MFQFGHPIALGSTRLFALFSLVISGPSSSTTSPATIKLHLFSGVFFLRTTRPVPSRHIFASITPQMAACAVTHLGTKGPPLETSIVQVEPRCALSPLDDGPVAQVAFRCRARPSPELFLPRRIADREKWLALTNTYPASGKPTTQRTGGFGVISASSPPPWTAGSGPSDLKKPVPSHREPAESRQSTGQV